MKKVRVYNVEKYIKEKYFEEVLQMDSKLGIVGGDNTSKNNIFIFCNEGVGWMYKDRDTIFEIDTKSNTLIKVPIKELIDNCEYEEVFVHDFVRKFGSRLEHNYKITCDSLVEIGIGTLKDFYNIELREV